MKKLIAVTLILSLTTIGCTGSFNLTKKVYNTHRSQADKWSDELLFLVFVIVPVYGISTFADAIVFNSIEFWTGENPVASTSDKKSKVVKKGDSEATLTLMDQDHIMVQPKENNRASEPFVIERVGDSVVARDTTGKLLYSAVKDATGQVSIFDNADQLVKTFPAGAN